MRWDTETRGRRFALPWLAGILALSLLPIPAGGDQPAAIDGGPGDRFGTTISSAGDVSGDGAIDLLVGAPGLPGSPGRAYLFLGGPILAGNLTAGDANVVFQPSAQSDAFGASVTIVRDMNGDGLDEVAIGDPSRQPAGSVHVFLGRAAWPAVVSAESADAVFAARQTTSFGSALASGDINGDGQGDLLLGSPEEAFGNQTETGALWAFFGPATSLGPTWTTWPAWDSPDAGTRCAVDLGDLDGDGDLDLLAGNSQGRVFGYRNVGGPRWPLWVAEPTWDLPDLGSDASPALGDLDADGDLDMWLGLAGAGVGAYENTGGRWTAAWTARPAWDPPATPGDDPTFGDLDGDGDLDGLLVDDGSGAAYPLENVGNATAPSWVLQPLWDPGLAGAFTAAGLGDLDADGDLDLVLGAQVGGGRGQAYGVRNVGNATAPSWARWPAWDSPLVDNNPDAAVADLDADGDNDLFIGENSGFARGLRNAQTNWVRISGPRSYGRFGEALATGADLDGDAIEDFIVTAPGGTGAAYLLRGGLAGELGLRPSWQRQASWDFPHPDTETAPELADLDADGDQDVMLGASSGMVHGYRNTGNRTTPSWMAEPAWDVVVAGGGDTGPGLADLDGDLDVDLLTGTAAGTTLGYRNVGNVSAPAWAAISPWNGPDLGGWTFLTLGDLDGDSDADTLAGETWGPVYGLRNAGNGTDPSWTRELAWDLNIATVDSSDWEANPGLADLDGDGDLDLVVGGRLGVFYGYENIGAATEPRWAYFPDLAPAVDIGTYAAPGFGDLDGDGDPDLLTGEQNGNAYAFRNAARFLRLRAPTGLSAFGEAAALGDFDGDGQADVAVGAPAANGTVALYLGPFVESNTNATIADVVLTGEGCNFGATLSFVTWNGDAFGDVAVGAPDCGGVGADTGAIYVYAGRPSPPPTLPPSEARRLDGVNSGDAFGFSLAFLPPGTGFALPLGWMAVGVPGHDAGGSEAGRVVLLRSLPSHLHALPPSATVAAGDVLPLLLVLHDDAHWPVPLPADLTVNLSTSSPAGVLHPPGLPGPNLTQVIIAAGSTNAALDYVDVQAGTWTVDASSSLGTAVVSVTVVPGPLASLTIVPANATVPVNRTSSFTAAGADAWGNVAPLSGTLWTTDVGSILSSNDTAASLQAAPVPSVGTVTAEIGNLSATATVTVVPLAPGPVARIVISPTTVGPVAAGSILVFSAEGFDANGTSLGPLAVNWTLVGGIGSFLGPGYATNVSFRAETAGSGRIAADDGQGHTNETGSFWVVAGSLASLTLSPASANILVGNLNSFTASGWDAWGNPAALAGTLWTTDAGTLFPINDTSAILQASPTPLTGGWVRATVGATMGTAIVNVMPNAVDPAILGTVPDQLKPEDFGSWVLDLTTNASDPDTPLSALRWRITGLDGSIVSVTGVDAWGNHRLTFTTRANAYGSSTLTLWLEDPQGNSASQTLLLEITPVNDRPLFTTVAPFSVRYDVPYRYYFFDYVSDVETPREQLVITSTDPGHITISGLWAEFLYPQDLLGQTFYPQFTVRDAQGATASTVAAVTVSDNFVPTLLQELPDVTLLEDQTLAAYFDLDDYFVDPDQNSLFFTYGNSHVTITIQPDHTVDFAAHEDWSGQEIVTFRAIDTGNARAEDIVLVTVLPVNDAPTIGGVPDLFVHYDDPCCPGVNYTFDLTPYIEDPDNATSELRVWTDRPTYVAFYAPMPMVMAIHFPASMNGVALPTTIYVSDGLALSQQTIVVTVTDDWPPEILVPLQDQAFPEDTVFENAFDVGQFFWDRDGDVLFYSFGQRNVFVAIDNGTRRVTFSARADWFGQERVTFRATDPTGALAEQTITVTVLPVNDAPRISEIPLLQVAAGVTYTLDLRPYIVDVDNDFFALNISLSASPSATLVLVGSYLLLTYPTGANNDAVQLTASDGALSATRAFAVEVVQPVQPTLWDRIYWPWSILSLALLSALLVLLARVAFARMNVEEVFLVHKKGALIQHIRSQQARLQVDDDVFSAMLTAIQDFVRDSFAGSAALDRLEFGGRHLLLERGNYLSLVLVYSGQQHAEVVHKAREVVQEIEEKHWGVLQDWDGDVALLPVSDHLLPLFGRGERALQRTTRSMFLPPRGRGGGGAGRRRAIRSAGFAAAAAVAVYAAALLLQSPENTGYRLAMAAIVAGLVFGAFLVGQRRQPMERLYFFDDGGRLLETLRTTRWPSLEWRHIKELIRGRHLRDLTLLTARAKGRRRVVLFLHQGSVHAAAVTREEWAIAVRQEAERLFASFQQRRPPRFAARALPEAVEPPTR